MQERYPQVKYIGNSSQHIFEKLGQVKNQVRGSRHLIQGSQIPRAGPNHCLQIGSLSIRHTAQRRFENFAGKNQGGQPKGNWRIIPGQSRDQIKQVKRTDQQGQQKNNRRLARLESTVAPAGIIGPGNQHGGSS